FGLDSGLIPTLSEKRYLLWKLSLTVTLMLVIWRGLKLANGRWRRVLIGLALAIGVFAEPRIMMAHVWFPCAKTSSQFSVTPPVERWLKEQPDLQRVYTRTNLFVRGYWTPPALDLPNMTVVRGLENVAGYDQLILERYSLALGNVGPDAVNPR